MERVASATTRRKDLQMQDDGVGVKAKNGNRPEPVPRYSVEVTLMDNISDDIINECIVDFDEGTLATAAFQAAKGWLEKADGQVTW
jgi:hypothetical protein